MQYTSHYESPIGGILLAADQVGLTGLWFDGGKYYANHLDPEHEERNIPIFEDVKRWLTIYFSRREPDFTPLLHVIGSSFQLEVWDILRKIPYGKIAKIVSRQGLPRMSA